MSVQRDLTGKTETEIAGITFVMDDRYEPDGQILGKGAYGAVISARDTITGQRVAIKRIGDMFGSQSGAMVDAKRVLRELKLMRHLGENGGCENVIKILDIMVIPVSEWEVYNEIYVVSELMPTSLRSIIRSGQNLTDQHVQCFVAQMLIGTAYIHASEVLHRDIKPENLVLDSDCNMKIIDFGLARHCDQGRLGYTEYVATRWYRAPEIVLQRGQYGKAADVWSIGCVMAELITGRPVFPGDNYLHQLSLIFDVVGTPRDPESLGEQTAQYVRQYGRRAPKKFKEAFPGISDGAERVLMMMLQPNPTLRPSCERLLQDPYFAKFREDIPPVEQFTDFDFEAENITMPLLRQLIVGEMCAFHPMPEMMEAPPTTVGIPAELHAAFPYDGPTEDRRQTDDAWGDRLFAESTGDVPLSAQSMPDASEATPGALAMSTMDTGMPADGRLTPNSANERITLGMPSPSTGAEFVTPTELTPMK